MSLKKQKQTFLFFLEKEENKKKTNTQTHI